MRNKITVAHLTPRQEIEVLDSIYYTESLGSGSSRVVYDLNDDVKVKLFKELGLLTSYTSRVHYVVKLALGLGGRTQSDNEYTAYVAYGDIFPLAPIVAAGQFVLIMEKLENDDITRCVCGIDDECPDGEAIEREVIINYHLDHDHMVHCYDKDTSVLEKESDLDEEALSELRVASNDAASVINDLNDLFGTTADNCQIGKNGYGCYLCYDYGFRGDGWGSNNTWSSRLSDWVDDGNTIDIYINKLIAALKETDDAYEALERIEHDVIEEAGYED